jgi:hypothetical protein
LVGQGELDLGKCPIRDEVVCAARVDLRPASLALHDVPTLYFETDAGDGFREPGFSKERRLEPQITIGLLTGESGFPLMVNAFEGNHLSMFSSRKADAA